ncbi:MAG: Gfo/Idh/MocA family protein, partial [Thermomicrobiales bacterium]
MYRAALVGCSRIGAFIDNEVIGSPTTILPYSHAAGYAACSRTALIAGADLRPEVLAAFGQRYDVSPDHQYTEFRAMIERERPDILSIATQPQHRTAVALFAIEQGVRALYCEKPLCASVAEAAALVDAVERHGVVFNMGTNRRWSPGYAAMRAAITSGDYGALGALNTHSRATLFNTGSHWFDLLQFLGGDAPVAWVQGYLPQGDALIQGDEVVSDPVGEGTIAFTNGVLAHLLISPQPARHEALCERATITARTDGRFEVVSASNDFTPTLLEFTPASATLGIIDDLVHSLDTGEPTRGGVRVAQLNTEIIFGLIESHRRGGARVALPLTDCAL